MAELNVLIKATNMTSAAIKDARDGLGDLERSADSVARGFGPISDAAGKAFEAIGKAALIGAAAVGTAFAGMVVGGLNSFSDLEKGMNEVFSLLPGISKEAMDKMTDQVQSFDKEFGVLSDQSVPALYQALSAGVPQENVFAFMEVAQRAAIGGVSTLETAVDGLTSVTNAYGSDVVNVGLASDLMFTAVRVGKTTLDELSGSLFNVTPVAANVGIEFGDVTAAMAALTLQGVPTSVAATELRALFIELSKAGGETSDKFIELSGQTFRDFVAGGGDVQGALKILEQGAKDAGVGIGDLFGSVEAGQAAMILTGQGTETFNKAMAAMDESAGATQAAYETMDGGISRSIDRIKASFQVMMQDVGEKLAPVFQKIADWVLVNMPTVETTVVGAFTQIADWAMTKLPTALGTLTRAFDYVRDTLLPLARERIPELIAKAREFWDMIAPMITKIGEWVRAFAGMESGQRNLILALGAAVLAIGPLASALSGIIAIAGGVGGALAGAGGVAAALVGLMTPLGWVVTAVGVLGVAWARDFGGIRTATGYAVQDISRNVDALKTNIIQSLASGMQSAQAGMRNAWSGLVSMVSEAGSSMRERSSTAGRGVGDALAGGLAGARHGFQGVLSNLASMVNGTFRDRSNDWITAGRNVATGIGAGVANQAGSLYSSMANLGRSLLGSFKNALGIRSPSTEFADAGYDMAWGLALGVDDGSALVYDAIGTMADTSSQMIADAAQAQLVAIADMQKAAAYETSKIDAMIAAGIAKNAAAVTAGMGQDRIIQGFNQAQYAAYWAALQAGESREQAIAKGQQVTGGAGSGGSGGAGSGGAAAQAAAAAAAAVAEANKKAEFDAWSARAGDLWSWIGKLGISGLQTAGMDPMGSGKSMTAVLEETLADVAKVLHGGAANDKIPALLTTMQTLIAANATNQVTGLQMAAIPAEMRLQMAGWMDEMSARLDAEKMAAAATAAAAAAAPKIDASLIDTVKNFVARTFGIGAGNLAGDLANSQSMVKQRTWGAFQDAGTYGMDVRGLTAANVFNATEMLAGITESSPVQAIKDALSKLVDFRNLQDDWTQFQSGGFRQSFGDTTRTGNTFNVTFTGSVTDRASVLSDIAFLNGLYGGATP